MKRAAIYARVSTEDQTDNTSFDTQVTDCRREAERRGYLTTEADVYLEDVSGAYGIDRRPVLRTVWEKYQTGFYDAIIVWHTDRLSRNLTVFTALVNSAREKRQCGTKGDGFIFARVPTEDTAEGRLLLNQLASFAEYERERIRLRTLTGKHSRAKEGAFFGGGELLGYQWNREKRRWEVVEEEANIVRLIYQMYVYGMDGEGPMGTMRIAERLQQLGIPTPNQMKGTRLGRPSKNGKVGEVWSETTVLRILTNTAYVGEHYFWRESKPITPESIKEEWIPVEFPAIVDRDLFEKAQEKRRNARGGFNRKKPRPLLAGRIRCGLCGHAYGVCVNGKKDAYKCNGRLKKYHLDGSPRCTSPILLQEPFEQAVKELLLNALSSPESARKAVEEYLSSLERKKVELETILGPANEQLSTVQEKMRRLAKVYLSGVLSDEEYHREQEALREQEQAIRQRFERYGTEFDTLTNVQRHIEDVKAVLESGLFDVRYSGDEHVVEEVAFVRVKDEKHLTVGFPQRAITWEELLDLFQVTCWVYEDRIEVRGLFPLKNLPIHKALK